PIGGVGINLAIQDAVAAANILAAALAYPAYDRNALTPLLAQVQRRRMFPARVTQAVQVAIQNRVLTPLIGNDKQPIEAPWVLKLMRRWPVLRALPAYAVGIGVRPEHIRSPRAT